MALLFMDGFGGGDAQYKWDNASSFGMASATPRVTGGYYSTHGSSSLASKSFPAVSKVFVGFGLLTNKNSSISFYGDAGGTQHITVVRNTTSGALEIRRGGTSGTLLATGVQGLIDGQWNYVEISCTISETVGEVHIRLNGSPTDDVSFTGDTKNGGTNVTIDRVAFLATTFTGGTTFLSDFYIADTSGSVNNNFLGDVVVRTLTPNGNGNYSQLTNSAGNSTNNYTYVDEHPYSATDYVGSPTTGLKDSYAMSDLPAGVSTIYAVQLAGQMLKSDATLGQARLFTRIGGSDYPGTTRALTTTATGYYDLFQSSPATSVAWTVSEVNGLESGMEVM